MILDAVKKKQVYKSIGMFLLFNFLLMIVTLPFNIFYGPFDNIRTSLIIHSSETTSFEKLIRFFISDSRYDSVINLKQSLYVRSGETVSKPNNRSVVNAETQNSIQGQVGEESVKIKDSDLKKLGWDIIQNRKGKLIYEIIVSIEQQKVYVYDIRDNKLVKEFICSTGKPGDETPKGKFTISERGEQFFNEKYQDGAYYWTRFIGAYLFHSIPFDKDKNIQEEEGKKLGQPASHGCVRLTTENAKWIYDNIPTGTQVIIE